jgi:D-sedoheptulose 7-phosphate isomerase
MKAEKNFVANYFKKISFIANKINVKEIELAVKILLITQKKKSRIFFLGVGGSAANCSHAVNDFRKICKIESYNPMDNVSELTARINDEGWDSSLVEWLKICNLKKSDVIFVFSVGGGSVKKRVSMNLVNAMNFAKSKNLKIISIVGREDGYASKVSDVCIKVPYADKNLITPFAESFQAVIWHCLVSHPLLQVSKTKW